MVFTCHTYWYLLAMASAKTSGSYRVVLGKKEQDRIGNYGCLGFIGETNMSYRKAFG